MENVGQELVTNLKNKLNNLTDQIDKLKADNSHKEGILESLVNERKKTETEVANLQKKIRSLEDELEQTETKLTEATQKLEEASKAADESERYRRMLECKQAFESNRIEQLKSNLNETANIAANSKRKYEETAMELQEAERQLDAAETRVENADKCLKSLEEEMHAVSGILKTMESEKDQANKQEKMYSEKIDSLKRELSHVEKRALEAEAICKKKQEELRMLDDALEIEKTNYEMVQQELNGTVAEISDL